MAPMKRPAGHATSAAGAPKKAKVVDPAVGTCKEISAAVLEAEGFPADVLRMLSGAVQDSLIPVKEERHAFQEKMIDMLQEVIATLEAAAAGKVATLEVKVGETDNEKASREAAAAAAVQDSIEKAAAVEAAQAALTAATSEVASAEQDKATAEKEQKQGDIEYNSAADQKARLETASSGDYATLKEGTAPATAKLIKGILKLGKDLHWDANMLTAGEQSLAKTQENRGSFDALVIQQLDDAFASGIAKFTDILNNGESAKAERAQKVETSTLAAQAAHEREGERKAELAAAQTALKEAETHVKASNKAVKDFDKDMKQVAVDLKAAKEHHEERQNITKSFRELVDRSAEVPEPSEPSMEVDAEAAEPAADPVADAPTAVA